MSAPPEDLVELMARGSYEHWRTRVPHRPPWDALTDAYASATRSEIRAALEAAIAAGWRFVKP
jgi:hypothetical protein